MKKTVLFFVVLITLISISNIYSQGIPQTINYQGVLKDASGVVVPNGDYSLTFKLYDLPSGGSALWNETKTINVVGGIINTQLGSVTPITSATIVGAAWLGITVGTGSELIPRITLTSVPYSIMSLTVPSGSITATKIADAQVVKSLNGLKDNVNLVAGSNVTITPSGNNLTINATGSGGGGTVTQVNTGSGLTGGPITSTGTLSISNDGITTSMLQNNSVTSGKITDGTIATTDLSDNSVTSAKIVDGTISATDIGTTQVVKSINTIKDNVTLVAGSNVTITPSGNNITIASTSGGTIGGSGTANYISKFTNSTTLGSSTLFDDGNRIGLGTNTPDFSLTVNTTPTLGLGLKVSRTGGGLIGLAIVEEGQPTSLRGWSFESWNQKLRINASGDNGITTLKNLMTLDRKGNIGIGTETPSYPLHIATNRKYAGYFTSDSLSYETHVIHAEYLGTGPEDAVGVYGKSVPADGFGYGGVFEGGFIGVSGHVNPTGDGPYTGVEGNVYGGIGNNIGVLGSASGSSVNIGVQGGASGSSLNIGIYGWASNGTSNRAGYFSGNVEVTGTLSKGGGSFKIDHPLDPTNKNLYHSFVESPDMMNIYNGNIVTDGSGYATVTMPDWFEALNIEFRYQLTVIGDFAQAIISQKIQNNQFIIRTDKPGIEVSWQVTGIRHDKFAEKYRIPVEENKTGKDVGKYLHPDAYGLDETLGVDYENNKADREKK